MKKLPIWAKTYEGKWAVFPCGRLISFDDGKRGFALPQMWKNLDEWEIYYKWRHLFSHEVGAERLILKADIEEQTNETGHSHQD